MTKGKVLIVDDNLSNVLLVSELLEEEGYKTLLAYSGKEAIQLVNENTNIDLILMDIMMPGMNGYETTAKIKSIPEKNNIPVIFLTALIDEQHLSKAFDCGAVDYIKKPFADSEIILRTNTHVNIKKNKSKLEEELKKNKVITSQLNETNEKLENLYNNVPIGLYKTTPEGQIAMANPAFIKMLGYDSLEEIQKININHINSENLATRSEFQKQIEKKDIIMGLEQKWRKKNGNQIDIRESAIAIRDKNGEIIFYEGNAEDITSKKKMEKALKLSEKKFRSLVESLPDIVYQTKNNYFTYLSDSAEKLLNIKPENLISSPKKWMDNIHPDDIDSYIKQKSKVLQGKKYSVEYRFKKNDGVWIWLLDRCISFKIDKNVLLTDGIITDITVRKLYEKDILNHKDFLKQIVAQRTSDLLKSEEKLKNIYNSVNEDIYITDLHGNFIEVNQMALDRLKSKRADFLKKNITEIIFDKEKTYEYLHNVIQNGFSHFESKYKLPEKKSIFIETTGKKITYEGEQVILHVTRDITERKNFDRRVLRAILETEEKERNRFAKDLHDGLGALLSGIKMYINLIQSGKLQKEQLGNILSQTKELISQAAQNAREIANNLKPHELSHFGLMKSIDSFAEKINETQELKFSFKYNESVELPEDLQLVIFRIVHELINNTLKHANANNIILSIFNNKTHVNIDYKDDGCGFDLKQHKKGMGLSNIINRLRSINGDIEIQSQSKEGFSAQISIPIV